MNPPSRKNINVQRPKMVRRTFKILLQMVQDFPSVSDHSGTLRIKGLRENAVFRPFYKFC